MVKHVIDSPLGRLTLFQTDGAISAVRWGGLVDAAPTPLLAEAAQQLDAYFAGKLTQFNLPLVVQGSRSQRAVCNAILAIPFGETRTYGALAQELGVSAQAVGQGCGGNPIPLIIPCHRVLGANGLGGFSGGTGIDTKVWLLRHENAGGLLI